MAKPSYIGLLNSIAVNEAKGERLLNTWAAHTQDAELKSALKFVAVREGEHAWAFTKRLCELGYDVDEARAFQVFKDFDGLLACAASDASDFDKVARLAGNDTDGANEDPFGGFFKDTSIDPETGALLGRYIAEERDSGRRLRAAYQRIRDLGPGPDTSPAGTPPGDDLDAVKAHLTALRSEVKVLRKKLKKLG